MGSPKVSLIMTVYNRERYLADSIASAINQTFTDFELLIWDDGSTDRSLQIACQFSQRDDRIRLFLEPHRGRCAALQSVHQQARGGYLGWLDSDDCFKPNTLAETVAILDHQPDVGMVYTQHELMNEVGENLGIGKLSYIPYSPKKMLVDFMTFHFRLFRRDCFEKAGGINPEMEAAIDYDLCLRLTEITNIFHLPIPLYCYRIHSQSMSAEKQATQRGCAKKAVEQALQRRNLSDRYTLSVNEKGIFTLNPVRCGAMS
jgi:glycosyltransferase involved in cell wall biosynthesis